MNNRKKLSRVQACRVSSKYLKRIGFVQNRKYVVCLTNNEYYEVIAKSSLDAARIVMKIGENNPPVTTRPPIPGQYPITTQGLSAQGVALNPQASSIKSLGVGGMVIYPISEKMTSRYITVGECGVRKVGSREALNLLKNRSRKSLYGRKG